MHPETKITREKLAQLQVSLSAIQSLTEYFDGVVKSLMEILRPICQEATLKFCEKGPYDILPDEIKVGIDLTKAEVSLEVNLRFKSNGCQPDEKFGDEEDKRLSAKMKPILDKLFRDNKIPMTFSRFHFPHGYYMS